MVEKLFYQDPYMKEADAEVVRIDGNKIFLDKTVFFAFSGGQESDSGQINEVKIVDLQADGNDIAHILESNSFKIGDKVRLKLEWEKRYKIMKLHSAAHIVYYLLEEIIGKREMIGSNVTHEKARIDYVYPESIKPLLIEVESKVNSLIKTGKEIKTFDDENHPGRRLWNLDDWMMPCGGTHVRNASEIGELVLKRVNLGSGKERVEIKLKE